jgi:hypothetical protein
MTFSDPAVTAPAPLALSAPFVGSAPASGSAPAHPAAWIKATRSTGGNACVEMRRHGQAVEVRDSKDPHGPVLRFSPTGFVAWLDAAREHQPLPD